MVYGDPTPILPLLTGLLANLSPEKVLRTALPPLLGGWKPRRIVTIGKAARAMARGAALLWPDTSGLLYEVSGPGDAPRGWTVLTGSHPLSTPGNVEATGLLGDWLGEGGGATLALVSGGTSALLADPTPPWTLDEERELCSKLLASGAPIAAVNAVRMRLSNARGGGLRRLCGAGPVFTGIWCDVDRRDFRLVGSAPTVSAPRVARAEDVLARFHLILPHPLPPDTILRSAPSGDRVALLASGETLAFEAATGLRAEGYRVRTLNIAEGTGSSSLAARFRSLCEGARRGRSAWVAVGEAFAPAGKGRGGRCSHLAAMAALEMSRLPGWTFLALATDGVDGNGGAGAWIRAGEIPTEGQILNAVRRGDTATLWESNGTGLPRNATGNNLRDLYVLTMEK